VNLDAAAIAAYTAGVRRARYAYQRDPTALGDLLAAEDACCHCRRDHHFRCNGRARRFGRNHCACHLDEHKETP